MKTAEIVKGNKHYNIHPRVELKTIVNYNLGLKGSKNFRKRAHHSSFISYSPKTQPKNRFRYETMIWLFLSWFVLKADPKKKANSSDIPFLIFMTHSLIYVNVF